MGSDRVADASGRLREYLESMSVWYRIFELPEPTMAVDAASKQLGVSPSRIIKTLLLVSEVGEPIIAIVCGDRRADLGKVATVCGSRVRMAKAKEVEKFTGLSGRGCAAGWARL